MLNFNLLNIQIGYKFFFIDICNISTLHTGGSLLYLKFGKTFEFDLLYVQPFYDKLQEWYDDSNN